MCLKVLKIGLLCCQHFRCKILVLGRSPSSFFGEEEMSPFCPHQHNIPPGSSCMAELVSASLRPVPLSMLLLLLNLPMGLHGGTTSLALLKGLRRAEGVSGSLRAVWGPPALPPPAARSSCQVETSFSHP